MIRFKTSCFIFIFSFLNLLACAGSDYRTFTGQDGAEIEAKIVEASIDKVTVEFRDGRTFKDVDLERFSAEDQKHIRSWVKQQQALIDQAEIDADSKLNITFLKGRDDEMNNYGDIDDRIVHFEPKVMLASDELSKTYTEVKGTAIVVGREVLHGKRYAVMDKQNFTMKVPPKEKVRWEGKGFKCRYDPDSGGFEYGGYLVVLRNRSGDVVMTKASKSIWERSPKPLLKAKKSTGYNREFTRKHKLYTTFGLP